jgi:putative membrane protein
MILPGISGAFILLILGKYEFITATLKNPLDAGNLAIIAVFCAGCAVGVIVFSRILSYLLTRHRAVTLSALTGLMIGALRKIWPWKEMAARRVAEGEVEVLAQVNVLPAEVDRGLVVALGLMILGFVVVFMLERFSGRLDEDDSV